MIGTDAGQINRRDPAEVSIEQSELEEIYPVDLDGRPRHVAELQRHLARRTRLDRGHFGQRQILTSKEINRFLRIGKAVLHLVVFANRFRGFAQAVIDLPHDVNRLPMIDGDCFGFCLGIDSLPVRDFAAHFQCRCVLALRELTVADDVPEAVEQPTFGITFGKLLAPRDHVRIPFQVEQRIRQRETCLIGRRIRGPCRDKVIQHLDRSGDQVHTSDAGLAQSNVLWCFRSFSIHFLRQRIRRGRNVRLGRVGAQQLLHHLD